MVAVVRLEDLGCEARGHEVGGSAHVGRALKVAQVVRGVVPLGDARLEERELGVVEVRQERDAAAPAPVEARLLLLIPGDALGLPDPLQLGNQAVNEDERVVIGLHDELCLSLEAVPKERKSLQDIGERECRQHPRIVISMT